MDLPDYYVPPAAGIATPTRDEIIKGGYLAPRFLQSIRPFISLDVLAAPAGDLAKSGRWALPAGELFFAIEGLAFITHGKRIGLAERYLGGTLFGVAKMAGTKVAELVAGKVIGEKITGALFNAHDGVEMLEALDKYVEGFENGESLLLPINRIVSLAYSFERSNMYGILQLDLVIEGDGGTFTTYNILAREEDGDIFRDRIPFIYFLRLNYEQRYYQTSLFQRYANPALEVPQREWSLATLSFKPEFYRNASKALHPDAPPVASIRLEALAQSRDVISRLRIINNQQYNIDIPSGKLFDLAA